MDPATVARYESHGRQWASARRPVRRQAAVAFSRRVRRDGVRLDLGAGAGRYTGDLGSPVVAVDAARAMLEMLRPAHPHARCVLGDLEALPFRPGSIAGTWSNMAHHHVPRTRLPLALRDLHGVMEVGAPLDLQVLHGHYEGDQLPDDDIGGRYFAAWPLSALRDVVVGAGFDVEASAVEDDVVRLTATRAPTLADTVTDGMRLLVCGLNPSVYSAGRGWGFARPGNRFWPAVIAAGLSDRPHDPLHALVHHGLGMTDLCKRATVASAELARDEYREGTARVERLVRWLQPGAVCFVGLEGWRAAVDRKAVAGPQPDGFGGRPAYLMPSTSGLNAHAQRPALVEHFRAATALADEA